MIKSIHTVLFFIFFCFQTICVAQNFKKEQIKNKLIGKDIWFYEDKTKSMSIENIIHEATFTKSKSSVLNFGTTQSTIWLKITINNFNKNNQYLEIQNPIIDYAQIYIFAHDTLEETTIISDTLNFSNKKIIDKNIIFKIFNDDEKERIKKTIYLKIISSEHMSLPIKLSNNKLRNIEQNNYNLFFGIYIGIILVMFFYNLFLYFSIKDVSFLFYIAYIISVGLAQASLKGYVFEFFLPNHPLIANKTVLLFSSLTGIFAILFLINFLQTKKFTPILHKIIIGLSILYLISFVFAVFDLKRISSSIVDLGGLTASIFIIATSIQIVQKGYRPAKFFLISWSLFLTSIILFMLKDFGVIPLNIVTDNIIEIGSALEVTLLSFALADRINILKKEKEDSQAEALNALLQTELIIRNQNIVLERKVESRTEELQNTNKELNNILDELKQTQSQLVNAEKMASLGQLTAGIAHEINNPINFVLSNISPLKRDIKDLYDVIQKYETTPNSFEEYFKEINSFKKEIDFEYIKIEIENLLKGIEEGAFRTSEIIKGLRTFSRIDEQNLKLSNIGGGIDSTLTLLNNDIGSNIDVIRDYSEIPSIECYPGKLNQVFMNILNNAIFAIKENKNRTEKGKLIIHGYKDGNYVKISIKDNGIGMTEEVKSKIFEPFFTTKDVGKGTGLGMSISFTIIEAHNGKFEINSTISEGTEIIISLPIDYEN